MSDKKTGLTGQAKFEDSIYDLSEGKIIIGSVKENKTV